jgi:hypothetical protein
VKCNTHAEKYANPKWINEQSQVTNQIKKQIF